MRLQINGALSSSGRTKHTKARYYYITEKIEDGDIEVKYCPTYEMWVDMLTKKNRELHLKKIGHSSKICLSTTTTILNARELTLHFYPVMTPIRSRIW